MINARTSRKVSVSEDGNDSQTPSSPRNCGRTITSGNKNTAGLTIATINDCTAFPIDGKTCEPTAKKPTNGMAMKTRLTTYVHSSISTLSLVNTFTIGSGK